MAEYICRKCRTNLVEPAKVCPLCGGEVRVVGAEPKPKKTILKREKSKKKKK